MNLADFKKTVQHESLTTELYVNLDGVLFSIDNVVIVKKDGGRPSEKIVVVNAVHATCC